jgi:hypothetical protein
MALLTAQSCQPSEPRPTEDYTPPGRRSNPIVGALLFFALAAMVAVLATGGVWLLTSKQSSNPSADTFLWFAGQDKTWDEYQREQEAAGNTRLDEKEYDWMQQALNDAYSK